MKRAFYTDIGIVSTFLAEYPVNIRTCPIDNVPPRVLSVRLGGGFFGLFVADGSRHKKTRPVNGPDGDEAQDEKRKKPQPAEVQLFTNPGNAAEDAYHAVRYHRSD